MTNSVTLYKLENAVATVWIAYQPLEGMDYYYGGSRLVDVDMQEEQVIEHIKRLAREESALKNGLINKILTAPALEFARLPNGVRGSRVGGGRCLIRPRTVELHQIFSDPAHPRFDEVLQNVFSEIGKKLNELGGLIKLTPDFGRFADCSNHLYRYTPHVLGIGCDLGGCGGKSSYSTSGIIGGMEQAGLLNDTSMPVTVIGSAGALGSELVEYLIGRGFENISLCDIQYDSGDIVPPGGYPILRAELGRFTDDALRSGGMIVATTWGHELENSNHDIIPAHARLVLAHNLCLPEGEEGVALAQSLYQRDIEVIPGALLTLGGALTSRLEWFHRQEKHETLFDKENAHGIANRVVSELTKEVLHISRSNGISPHAALYQFSQQ